MVSSITRRIRLFPSSHPSTADKEYSQASENDQHHDDGNHSPDVRGEVLVLATHRLLGELSLLGKLLLLADIISQAIYLVRAEERA